MPDKPIIYEKKEHVAYITLDRPGADNIINEPLARELEDACRQANQDDDIYVVVITGAGDRVFCGGGELEKSRPDDNASIVSSGIIYGIAIAIASIDRPVVAAINGDALGQGLELALSCDIRLASDKAKFGFPQVAWGMMPMDGGTQRLPRIVGKGKALELVLTADTISAGEAFEIGLVNKVVLQENLAAEVEALAVTMASKGPIALRYIKEAVNKGLDLTLEQGLHWRPTFIFYYTPLPTGRKV